MTSTTLNRVVTLPSLGYEEWPAPPNPVDATTYPLASYTIIGERPYYAWIALDGSSDPGEGIQGAMGHIHNTTPIESLPLPFMATRFQVRLCTSITPLIDPLLVLPMNLMESKVIPLFTQCIAEAIDEVFMDGMDSTLSLRVTSLVIKYDNAAVSALDHLLSADKVNAEISGEILRTLGSLDNGKSYFSRLRLLADQLKSSDPRIRDAASLGLASLDEPMSLPALREAHAVEKSELVQRNIGLVIAQLEQS